jgi:hypothetical protein
MVARVQFLVEDGCSMSNKKNQEPRDEFDHVMLPAFLEKPISYLNNQTPIRYPTPAEDGTQGAHRADGTRSPYSDDDATPSEHPEQRQQAPRKWYAGPRGKVLIYGAGMIVMTVLQFRGNS